MTLKLSSMERTALMTGTRTHAFAALGLAGAMVLLSACGGEDGTPAQTDAASSRPGWLLDAAPSDAVSVVAAKADAAEGDVVVVRGIIGGRVEALSAESPVFPVVDAGLANACTLEDDHCPTPWDYCCAPSDELLAHSATVLIVPEGSDSADPVAAGLEPLDEVIIVGTVDTRPSTDVLTIRATGVYNVSR